MARVPLQVARMAGAPPKRHRPAGERPAGRAARPGQVEPVAVPAPLPRPGLLEVARLSVRDLLRRAGIRRVRTRRPA